MIPEADAPDEVWQLWAANQLGMNIREPGAIFQNPKIYSCIFKHRFPLFTQQASMDDVLSAKDWHFQAQLDYTAHCVCTNFICRLHLMRNDKLGIDKIIGKDCFDRYFAEKDEHWKSSRDLRIADKHSRARALERKGSPLLHLTSMSFKDTFDAESSEVEWARDTENLICQWKDFKSYQMACSTLARLGKRTLLLQNQAISFEKLASTNPRFVHFVRNEYKGTSPQYAEFSRYLAALRTADMLKDSIFTFSGETFEDMSVQPRYQRPNYFSSDEWKAFTEYVVERTVFEEDNVRIRRLVKMNDSLNKYDKNERDAHIESRRKRRKERHTEQEETCELRCEPCD